MYVYNIYIYKCMYVINIYIYIHTRMYIIYIPHILHKIYQFNPIHGLGWVMWNELPNCDVSFMPWVPELPRRGCDPHRCRDCLGTSSIGFHPFGDAGFRTHPQYQHFGSREIGGLVSIVRPICSTKILKRGTKIMWIDTQSDFWWVLLSSDRTTNED